MKIAPPDPERSLAEQADALAREVVDELTREALARRCFDLAAAFARIAATPVRGE